MLHAALECLLRAAAGLEGGRGAGGRILRLLKAEGFVPTQSAVKTKLVCRQGRCMDTGSKSAQLQAWMCAGVLKGWH